MDIFQNENRLLKLFVEFLGNKTTESSGSPEIWDSLEKEYGPSIYSDLLYLMTRKEFGREEAKTHWRRLLEHQAGLESTLGRDPGFQVALCDYFTNIHPLPGNLVLVEFNFLMERERNALIDGLTGLYNRRYLERTLTKEIQLAKRFNQAFALLVLRIDKLSDYIKVNGQDDTERLLAGLADLLLKNCRIFDQIFRYDDETMAIVLPNTDRRKALNAAERHHKIISDFRFPGNGEVPQNDLTVTMGMALYPDQASDKTELMNLVVKAMELGRSNGGNRIIEAD